MGNNKIRYLLIFILLITISAMAGIIYLRYYSKDKRVKNKINENHCEIPFYLKISSGSDYIPESISKEYIDFVRNFEMRNGKTYGFELANSFPSVPKEFRSWEFHKYKDKNYVCYILRLGPNRYISYIWEVKEEYGVPQLYPANVDAMYLRDIDNGINKNKGLLKIKSEKEKKIINFLMDRETYLKDEDAREHIFKIASKKYKIPIDDIINIINNYLRLN